MRRTGAIFFSVLLLGCLSCGTEPSAPNVVLIVVDTLRADALGCYGASGDPTPAIDRLAGSGTRFQACRAHSSWTLPSVGTILSGRYPTEHGGTHLEATLSSDVPLLAERLRERGYTTGAVVTHDLVGTPYGFDRGFDLFDEELAARHHRSHSSQEVTARGLSWLASVDRPAFLFLHYFDPHFNFVAHDEITRTSPYDGPLRPGMDVTEIWKISDTLTSADHQFLRELYDGEVRFLDRSIGRLVEGLEKLGLEDDTIVILTADHGEEFFEHGSLGHTRSLHREVLSVPLIFQGPGVPVDSRADTAWLLDVVPTVLGLLGEEPPDLDGRDLFGERTTERTTFAEANYDVWLPESVEAARQEGREPEPDDRIFLRSVQQGRWKAIQEVGADRWRLFDLARDPGETHDLAPRGPEALDELKTVMEEWRSSLVPPEANEGVAPSPERIERLRALGYLK